MSSPKPSLECSEGLPEGRTTLTEAQKAELAVVKGKEIQLRKWFRARKDYSEEEEGALACQNFNKFADYWTNISVQAKNDFNRDRQWGWRKWARKYQSFGAGVLGFMRDWEPLINIVQGGGGGYGDMAIGTISLLFMASLMAMSLTYVASSKEKSEGYLSEAIDGIKDRMLGFSMYEDIYRDIDALEIDLRSKIVGAYISFVNLAIEATKYYKGGGKWRWIRSIRGPMMFKEMATEVEEQIIAIRLRCEDLLSKSVSEIKKGLLADVQSLDLKLGNLRDDNKELAAQINVLQQNTDSTILGSIHRAWGLGETIAPTRPDEVSTYRRILCENFEENYEQFWASHQRRNEFEKTRRYQDWKQSGSSKLFVLGGCTHISTLVQQYYCWLSPLLLDLIEQKQRDHEICAYYLLPVKRHTPLHDIIMSILFQLIKHRSFLLRDQDKMNHLIDLYQQYMLQTRLAHRQEALQELAVYVVKLFTSQETVYVLVDRLDMCEKEGRLALLDTLGCMIEGALCKLRVFVIIDWAYWSFELEDIDKTHSKHFILCVEKQGVIAEPDY
ncbi:hypothetical protein BJ875DRAFT_518676 [Amylocarpus encephaloides]|uniref:Nephrocystin 3-like N-terminal domain-containing protein n=1 Tax=Amylocarpus encephaloides TaxID=45428 RepID=A0A9P7YCD2_9HELO|nr:hypothetical protein BJ875DRAFT_518676 [Amylocarpus encephaloides]